MINVEDVCGVTVTFVGNGHGDPSSNLGQGCLHFSWREYPKESMNPTILSPAKGKL